MRARGDSASGTEASVSDVGVTATLVHMSRVIVWNQCAGWTLVTFPTSRAL